jgi:hypothetical protein
MYYNNSIMIYIFIMRCIAANKFQKMFGNLLDFKIRSDIFANVCKFADYSEKKYASKICQ